MLKIKRVSSHRPTQPAWELVSTGAAMPLGGGCAPAGQTYERRNCGACAVRLPPWSGTLYSMDPLAVAADGLGRHGAERSAAWLAHQSGGKFRAPSDTLYATRHIG